MNKKRFLLGDLFEEIEEDEIFSSYKYHEKKCNMCDENEEDSRVEVNNNYLIIKSLNLAIYCAAFQYYYEASDVYMTDFDFWIFTDLETGKELYSEQGSSLIVSLRNYFTLANIKVDMSTIWDSECIIENITPCADLDFIDFQMITLL